MILCTYACQQEAPAACNVLQNNGSTAAVAISAAGRAFQPLVAQAGNNEEFIADAKDILHKSCKIAALEPDVPAIISHKRHIIVRSGSAFAIGPAPGFTAIQANTPGNGVFKTADMIVSKYAAFQAVIAVLVYIQRTVIKLARGGIDTVFYQDRLQVAHAVPVANSSKEFGFPFGMVVYIVLKAKGWIGPCNIKPIAATKALFGILFQLSIGESAGLLAADMRTHHFCGEAYFRGKMICYRTKTGVGKKLAVIPVTIAIAVIEKCVIIYFFCFSANGIIGIKQGIAADCLLCFKLYFFSAFASRQVDFTSVAKDIVYQSTKLGTVLQGTLATHNLNTLHCLQLWVIISLGIPERICSNIVTILTNVEFPTAVRTKATCGYTDLYAAGIAFPNVYARYFCQHLAHVVVYYVALYIVQYNQ